MDEEAVIRYRSPEVFSCPFLRATALYRIFGLGARRKWAFVLLVGLCVLIANGCLIWSGSAARQGEAELAKKHDGTRRASSPSSIRSQDLQYAQMVRVDDNSIDWQAQELLMDQELIRFAGSKRFSHAKHSQRFRMLRRWCHRHLRRHFQSMSTRRQHN